MQTLPKDQRKSTTHQEMYFHFRHQPVKAMQSETDLFPIAGTVFAREVEKDKWFAVVALCSPFDIFEKAKGRQAARRKFFNCPPPEPTWNDRPTYDQAREFYEQVFTTQCYKKLMMCKHINKPEDIAISLE